MSFKIEKFEDSFYKIFYFFLKNKVRVGKDFMFLGIYLVTLYTHLEHLGQQSQYLQPDTFSFFSSN